MNQINVITIHQPWATLIAHQAIGYDVRIKPTTFVGTYLIHAAPIPYRKAGKEFCERADVKKILAQLGYNSWKELPKGQIIGAYEQEKCLRIPSPAELNKLSLSDYLKMDEKGLFNVNEITDDQKELMDLQATRFVWMGRNYRVLKNPFAYKNGQSYYSEFTGDLSLIESACFTSKPLNLCTSKPLNLSSMQRKDFRPKVLSLWQPWATLLAYGLKLNETRPSATSYVGTQLIHATGTINKQSKWYCEQEFFKEALASIGIHSWKDLPRGAIVGAYDQEACWRITQEEELIATRKHATGQVKGKDWMDIADLTDQEYAFGNYNEGRYIWTGSDHRFLTEPIPYKNGQGYYLPYKGDFELILPDCFERN